MYNCLRLASCIARTGTTSTFSSFSAFKTISPARSFVSNALLVSKPNGGGITFRDATKKSLLTIGRTFRTPVSRYCTKPSVPQERGSKAVGYWLLGCSGMVFVAVILGGVTRLTESGLSMVTWKLLGEQMPRTDAEWQEEFDRYQQFPEFKLKNQDITMQEFKLIWYMEYGHRMWGRAIGAFYSIPALYFWTKGYFNKAMKIRVLAFGALIGAQGLMGWYMVKSGLEDRFHEESDVPRVSQYRLASHLGFAFVLYSLFLWSALDKLLPAQKLVGQIPAATFRFKGLAHATKAAVFLTALSGAFVAGLDAGLIYNSFPKMADRWIPSDILALSPALRNFTENPTTVQFDHRVLGTATLTLITGMFLLSRRRLLPPRAYKAATAVAAMGWMQVALGITTLLTYVPVPLAASHQSGSLVLLSLAIWLTHELKLVKRLPK
ncbi:cytochrome c oxidase assembly protein COX15 homolog isoform X2 [Anopheles arabiensis]|uniref:Cytochrome c oxidase assembly protein COX15 n=1 Tax=Anopheles arabiensis TaxID=7173 RepID=A0A499FPT5_ANOAR|nr:cytochrome c oxidase assembly protein COX15 homolog isoform X2 [Anopheles arabiensis]